MGRPLLCVRQEGGFGLWEVEGRGRETMVVVEVVRFCGGEREGEREDGEVWRF